MVCLGHGHDHFWCSVGPDAPVESITVTPTSVKPGDKITISGRVHGVGAWFISCGNFTLNYYFDGKNIGCYEDRITKGQYWSVSVDYIIPAGTTPGTHTIKVEESFSKTSKSTTITVVKLPEGKAVITNISRPTDFTSGVSFSVGAMIRNDGGQDDMFVRLIDVDTGKVLATASRNMTSGLLGMWVWTTKVSLSQKTDFHGRIDAGHVA
jgi:hypothetical protein